MKKRLWIVASLLVVAAWATVWLSCDAAQSQSSPLLDPGESATSGPAPFLSTEFEACDTGSVANPSPQSISNVDFSDLLHGVWVGQRTARNGVADDANYMLIFDTEAREGMAYEERGQGISGNAFEQLLPAPLATSPSITYFYCGGAVFGPFKDRFVKVSTTPADGLAALGTLTGVAIDETSVFGGWSDLRAADYFTKPLTNALRNVSFYTMSIVPVQRSGSSVTDVRWDMVGQYRGSPEKLVNGQPVPGFEGGLFEGTTSTGEAAPAGDLYVVSSELLVTCYCDPTLVDRSTGMPLTNFGYDKVVIGPIF